MNDPATVKEEYLPTLVLPLRDSALVLPSHCVAEVMMAGSIEAEESSPHLLGFANWRERELPVLSFEALRDGQLPQQFRARQLAVLNAIGGAEGMSHFAVAVSAMPHHWELSEDQVETLEVPDDLQSPAIQGMIKVAGQSLVVPDWDYLQQQAMNAYQQRQPDSSD
ncbi:chemotaxis protein CheW [Spongiibacter nanhainus]|uniref:Chemotaxis protein CheW n=1 Tax=Spongiibacter nanhainus TaxID=2794344 RepID=A0A7T4UQ90_9GAMM|nr:chemotaxis protein CheW [Spongiibacter nanhainus]QQD18513.1 chemotaxis protein CheW [Spongiibacter nanhainus]